MSHHQLHAREYTIEEIMTWRDPDWLVEGFIEEHSCAFISAQPKVGKSFFALRLGAAVSSGSSLFGHTVRQANLLYLAAERAHLMKRRIRALQVRGIPIDPDRFRIWPDPVIFSDHEAVRNFVRAIKIIPDLLIVDTLRRCNDGDERDNTHMGRWTKGVELFRDLTGASVLVVHHDHRQSYTNHGRALESSFSGAGTILGSLDGYFSIRPQSNGTVVIRSEGSNERNAFHVTARIEGVDLGEGRSTGVMVEVDPDGVIEAKPELDVLALEVLRTHPGITQKEWYERCRADAVIARWWPKLDKGSISRIKQQHVGEIREEPNPVHRQQPFLRAVTP